MKMKERKESYVLQMQIGQFEWKDDGESSNLLTVKLMKRRFENETGEKYRIVMRTDIVII